MRRAAMDYYLGTRGESPAPAESQAQNVPVNVYESGEDIVIVAPMPGVESGDIDVEVLGRRVILRAALRGPGQADRQYHVHEWTYGPYYRAIDIPIDVDAEHANASHGNGVLVLSLPKARHERAVHVPLRQSGSAGRSMQRGHSGHHTTRGGLRESTDE